MIHKLSVRHSSPVCICLQLSCFCLNITGDRNSLPLKAIVFIHSVHSVNIFTVYHVPSAAYGLTS